MSHWHIAACILSLQFFQAGCGGGGSTSTAPPPPPPPPPPPTEDFSLLIGPNSVTLQQGGTPQKISVSASLGGTVTSTLMVSFPNLPQGVTVWPNQPTAFGGDQGTTKEYFLSATSAAQLGQVTINISGTLGSVGHSYSLPVTITAAATFQLSLSPAKLSLTPGVPQSVQVTVVPNSGPPPVVNLSVSSVPTKWDLTSPVETGTEPGPFTLTFTASITSQPFSNFPLFVTATSGPGGTSTIALPASLTVPFPPITAATRSTVVRTDDVPAGAVYDAARKLVFVALPNLNEVRVYSSLDAHLVATIPTFHPSSIDESADGSKVFTGSIGLITTIDPDSLQVLKSNAVPTPTGLTTIPPIQLFTLSTGEVMFVTGTQLYLWDPVSSGSTPLNVPNLNQFTLVARSGDHTKVLVYASSSPVNGSALIYDAKAGTFGSPSNANLGASAAMNQDGSQIATLLGGYEGPGTLNFYDGQINLLASENMLDFGASGNLIYGMDGKSLYVFVPSVGIAYDTSSLLPLGLFSMGDAPGTVAAKPFAVDETGMVFGPGTGTMYPGALAFTDASHPGAMIPDSSVEESGFPPVMRCPPGSSTIAGNPYPPAPEVGVPNAVCWPGYSPLLTSTWGLGGVGFDQNQQYNLFVGPPPASSAAEPASNVSVFSEYELDFEFPPTLPNNTPGPVNLTLTRPDGWYQVIPEGFSYGPTILFAEPTGIPPSGGTTVSVFGYFLRSGTVTIGGKPATVVSSGPYIYNGGIFPLQQLQFTAPAASPGPADVTVTTSMGSTTLPGAVHYLNSAQVFAIPGTLGSISYDQPRQRLYISNTDHNRVEVFNLATQALLSPISVGNAPTNLDLTPDGTRLAVLNSTDGTISVIDPVQMKVLATYPGYTSQDQANCVGNPPPGMSAAIIAPHRELIAFGCPYVVHVLNLDTGAISCSGIAGCDTTGTILNAGLSSLNPQSVVAALASSADGTKAFMTSGLSAVALLDLTQNTLTTLPGVRSQGANAAINTDGNLFASNLAVYNAKSVPVNLASEVGYLGYLDTENEGAFGGGEAFNPSGSLLFLPSSGVDVFDVHRGRLALRLALPEQPSFPKTPSLVVDETGSKVFILTQSGVTIAQIAAVPLSIASVNPTSGASGTTVTIRGSGFQTGATVLFGTTSATATYVDGMTLTATVPNLSSGPVRVTVTNPGGQKYFFDAAFTVN